MIIQLPVTITMQIEGCSKNNMIIQLPVTITMQIEGYSKNNMTFKLPVTITMQIEKYSENNMTIQLPVTITMQIDGRLMNISIGYTHDMSICSICLCSINSQVKDIALSPIVSMQLIQNNYF